MENTCILHKISIELFSKWRKVVASGYKWGKGGTIAMFMGNMDVDTVDLGVAVLSMHAPFELTAKLDVYYTYKAFLAFNR